MIKQQRTNKLGNKALFIVELLLIIGFFAVRYFTRRKMGMTRFVMYVNYEIDKMIPVKEVKLAFVLILILLSIGLVIHFIKAKSSFNKVDSLIGILINLAALILILLATSSVMKEYYFLVLLAILIGLTHFFRVLFNKNQEAASL